MEKVESLSLEVFRKVCECGTAGLTVNTGCWDDVRP